MTVCLIKYYCHVYVPSCAAEAYAHAIKLTKQKVWHRLSQEQQERDYKAAATHAALKSCPLVHATRAGACHSCMPRALLVKQTGKTRLQMRNELSIRRHCLWSRLYICQSAFKLILVLIRKMARRKCLLKNWNMSLSPLTDKSWHCSFLYQYDDDIAIGDLIQRKMLKMRKLFKLTFFAI